MITKKKPLLSTKLLIPKKEAAMTSKYTLHMIPVMKSFMSIKLMIPKEALKSTNTLHKIPTKKPLMSNKPLIMTLET
jgi:hypothetical protein